MYKPKKLAAVLNAIKTYQAQHPMSSRAIQLGDWFDIWRVVGNDPRDMTYGKIQNVVAFREILDLAAGRAGNPAGGRAGNPAAGRAGDPAAQAPAARGRGGRGGRGRGNDPALAPGAQTVDVRAGEETNVTLNFESPESLILDILTGLPKPATPPEGAVVRGRGRHARRRHRLRGQGKRPQRRRAPGRCAARNDGRHYHSSHRN